MAALNGNSEAFAQGAFIAGPWVIAPCPEIKGGQERLTPEDRLPVAGISCMQ